MLSILENDLYKYLALAAMLLAILLSRSSGECGIRPARLVHGKTDLRPQRTLISASGPSRTCRHG